jgi:hypothetical protein
MSTDQFPVQTDTMSSPARFGANVTKSDVVAIDPLPKAIYVGTGGDVAVRFTGGASDVTFKNVPAGTVLPIRPLYIRAASTASDFVALN